MHLTNIYINQQEGDGMRLDSYLTTQGFRQGKKIWIDKRKAKLEKKKKLEVLYYLVPQLTEATCLPLSQLEPVHLQ